MPPDAFSGRQAHGGTVISSARPEKPKGQNYPVPQGWRSVLHPNAMHVQKCNEILKGREPKGTFIVINQMGKDYLYAVEWHKHAATDKVPAALKDWHRGVTVYEQR